MDKEHYPSLGTVGGCVTSQLWGVLIGTAATFVFSVALTLVNNRLAASQRREDREYDLAKERIRWAMEHNLSIYTEFMGAAHAIVRRRRRGDDDAANSGWYVFHTTLERIRLVGSPEVRAAAEACDAALGRYHRALMDLTAPPEQHTQNDEELMNSVSTEREAWEAAEKQFHDAVRKERGEPIITDGPTSQRPWWRGGRWLSKGA
jgi:hypothetical protein